MRPTFSFPAIATFGLVVIASGCTGSSSREVTGQSHDALGTICGAHTDGAVQGVDVSSYTAAVDWTTEPVQFGIARIGDGTGSADTSFDTNWAGMKANGILRGAYQYFEPGQDEAAQASLMIAKVGVLGEGDLPAMLDVEVNGGLSVADLQLKVQHWLDLVETGTGRKPFIYGSSGQFLEDNLGDSFSSYPLWVSGYAVTCPSVPSGWTTWEVWQYSDGDGALDHDVYNGTLADLKAKYAGPSGLDGGTPPSNGDAGDAGPAPVPKEAGVSSQPQMYDEFGDDDGKGGGCSAAPSENRHGPTGFVLFGLVAVGLALLRRRGPLFAKTRDRDVAVDVVA